MATGVKLYSLSTCGSCKAVKRLLEDAGVAYTSIDVDLLEQEEKISITNELKQINPSVSFPTLLVDDSVIVGYRKDEIRAALNLTSPPKPSWVKSLFSKFKG